MTAYLQYTLVNGFVHNWLVGGPLAIPIDTLPGAPNMEADTLQRVYMKLPLEQRSLSPELPGQPMEMVGFTVGEEKLTWRYFRTMGDHLIDLSAHYPLWNHLNAWAFTVLKLQEPHSAVFVLTAPGPVEVWLNGKRIDRRESFRLDDPQSHRVDVDLQAGENEVLVRFEMVGARDVPFTLALQVTDLSEASENQPMVLVPTQAKYPRRHEIIEAAFEKAYLEEVVNHRGAHFNLRWAEDTGTKLKYEYQVQDRERFSYVDGGGETDPKKPHDVGHTYRIKERALFVALRPVLLEYFDHNLRYEKRFPIHVLDNAYSEYPYGTLADRTRDALENACNHEGDLFAEIAKLRLGRWVDFLPAQVERHIQRVNRREAGSESEMMGLLGILYRFSADEKFPADLKQPLEDCVLGFKYWQDEHPGEQQPNEGLVFADENHAILFHASEVVAGQRFPQRVFTHTGQTGEWHRRRGEGLALEWLRLHGAQGFAAWNSNDAYETILAACAHLAGLAEDVALRELAAVMMDKILFSMAVNSYKGSFGSTHGWTSPSMLKSSQLEATSGISRMMWGMGVYNSHILGVVSLACSDYDFPLLIGDIATDTTRKVEIRERQVVDPGAGASVDTLTYKTADYMLSSAQDYRPGERGGSEHIWQATLGHEAVVFTNHPAYMSNDEAHRPGFWLGNRVLPRVAQWRDVLVAAYRLPDDDWMGFTHAYFPTFAFSEYEIRRNHRVKGDAWAFARKDNSFLALTAARGFELIQHAPDGYRELRSPGKENVWLCHMGSMETDGSFEKFKKRILAMKVEWQPLAVQFKSLRGEQLSFGWEGTLLVNGTEQAITGFKHHESPYGSAEIPARQMDIQFGGTLMRLDFS